MKHATLLYTFFLSFDNNKRKKPHFTYQITMPFSGIQKAMAKLLRGCELELAACVGNVLGTVPELTHLATEYLARRCEKIGRW